MSGPRRRKMFDRFLRTACAALVLAVATAPGVGSARPVQDAATLRLKAPPPRFEPVAGGRWSVPRIPDFGHISRPGEPELPLRILLVAIPEGSAPELRIRRAASITIDDLDLGPVPALRVTDRKAIGAAGPPAAGAARDPAGAGGPAGPSELPRPLYRDAFIPDPEVYGRDADFPATPVRLGSVGYLREQRFVEVLFTPLLYNPGRRRARFYPEVEAEVIFNSPGPPARGVAARAEGLFEPVYRRAFVNYEQGRAFRSASGGQGAGPPPGAESSGGWGAGPASGPSIEAAATGPAFKILVSAAGIYRLDHDYLQANAPEILAADPRTLRLSAEGVEVPISIRDPAGADGEADGRLDPGDFLEFYGLPKTESPAILNHDFGSTFPDIFQANDFTDTQVYWLAAAADPGPRLRIPSADGAPGSPGLPAAPDFASAAVWEENDVFFPLGEAEPYFSIPSLLAGSAQEQRDVSLALPDPAAVAAAASVTVRLRGGTSQIEDPDHRTQVWVNGNTSEGVDFTWDGEVIHEQEFSVSQSSLADPTTVHLLAPGIAGVGLDRQYLDRITVRYRRRFRAVGDALTFSYPNQDARFEVEGFSGAAPTIYEVGRSLPTGGQADPVRITGAAAGVPTSTYTFEVRRDDDPAAPALRSFVVAGPGGIRIPDAILRAPDPVLKDPANAADILVIAARDTVDPSPGGALDALLSHRLTTQGLTSRVVYIDQIYDEFSFGLRDVNAVRAFLAYAFDNWRGGGAAPPSVVLLVGDGTPDYKNTLGRADWVDQVPTPIMFHLSSILGYYSSDNWIASFRGDDQLPDVILGRISARTAAEAAAVFDKIRLYEQSPPPGLWKGRALFVAGDGKFAGEAASFESIHDDAQARYFARAPYSAPDPPLYFARPPWNAGDAAGFRTALLDELGGGAAILSYIGHGSFDTWGLDTFFTTADAKALSNDGPLPFMLNINCLAGGFHFLLEHGSLGEGMTNNPAGGAIATLAPSGLSNVFAGEVLSDQVLEPLFGPAKERVLGPATLAVRTALWSRGSIVDLQSYTFLGDPLTVLATPAPPPPADLAASAGNAEVQLFWTPPPEPVAGVRLFRARADPAGPYAPVECEPTGPSSCADRTVDNAVTYYYYAVSLDDEGFEGRASNFNSDCDAGPDCVAATPINPDPPGPPAGLAASDPGAGDRILLAWLPNPEPDIREYVVHYGTASGEYPFALTVDGQSTSAAVTGLLEGVRYVFALSAVNTSGLEGALSEEVAGVPHIFLGIAPPRVISDLSLARSGPDLILSWTPPAVDIYGRPTTVVGFRVHRDVVPGFVPSPANLIDTVGDGSTWTYVDAGAASTQEDLFYIVIAEDAGGLLSGGGRELPNGILDLAADVVSPDRLRLFWPPVLADIQGLPTLIDHYEVHSAAAPAARASLGPSTLVMDNVRDLSVELPLPTGPVYFSVLAVDNRGNLSPF
ncbi:MAG: C25 family cysteine peptidase [Acidobacteriota bacterium]